MQVECSDDNISSYFHTLALPYIIKVLACMFTRPLENREFPTLCKVSRVIPIFREGDKMPKKIIGHSMSFQSV